jgi:rRNA maturation RNase YbeY
MGRRESVELKITAGSISPSVRGKEEFDKASGVIEAMGARGAGALRIGITLIGERRMALLNREYKNRRGIAEILTFVYSDDPAAGGEDSDGEILICWKRIPGAAAELGVPAKIYLLRLIAHGLSHIEGFSHGDEVEAKRMERRERELLEGLVPAEDLDRMLNA